MNSDAALSTFSPRLIQTGIPLPLERFLYWERQQPDQTFIKQMGLDGRFQSLTWRQTGARVRHLLWQLRQQQIETDAVVAVIAADGCDWMIAVLAIWAAGATALVVHSKASAAECQFALQHAEPELVLIGSVSAEVSRSVEAELAMAAIRLDWSNLAELPESEVEIDRSPAERNHAELALIIYSPGTEGQMRGVCHTFSSLASAASMQANQVDVFLDDRILCSVSLGLASGVLWGALVPLYQGAEVCYCLREIPGGSTLKMLSPSILVAAPGAWAGMMSRYDSRRRWRWLPRLWRMPILGRIVRHRARLAMGAASLRLGVCVTAPLQRNVSDWFAYSELPLHSTYGQTETLGYALTQVGETAAGFQPSAHVEVKVSEKGMLKLRGPMLFTGYYRDPEHTEAVMDTDGYYTTGDIVGSQVTQSLLIKGRARDQFKSRRGMRVSPLPIEMRLCSVPWITRAWVFSSPLTQPTALVTLSGDLQPLFARSTHRDETHLKLLTHLRFVNDHLNPHEQLKMMIVVRGSWNQRNGLLATNGALRRDQLSRRYETSIERWVDGADPVIWES